MPTFAVLSSVYIKDSPEKLARCLESVIDQDFKVNEMVLVEDGPITSELRSVISAFAQKFQSQNIVFKSVSLDKNQGLPSALNHGLKATNAEWVFRIDSDDICLPHRFKIQKEAQEATGADILGGRIQEFSENCSDSLDISGERCIKTGLVNNHKGYYFRNPINHMTVLYRRRDILNLGGYQDLKCFEDYELWVRAINNGYKVYNVDHILCKVDIEGLLMRRSGSQYLKNEITFFLYCARRYKGKVFFVLSGILRFWIRLLPNQALKFLYTSLTRK